MGLQIATGLYVGNGTSQTITTGLTGKLRALFCLPVAAGIDVYEPAIKFESMEVPDPTKPWWFWQGSGLTFGWDGVTFVGANFVVNWTPPGPGPGDQVPPNRAGTTYYWLALSE